MSHPDEGSLRALLDDETTAREAEEIRAHVALCDVCGATLRRVQETQLLTTALLDALDVPAPSERVRARLAEQRGGKRPARGIWIGRSDLARAALLLLGFAGMVTAAVHPASPLRQLLMGPPESAVTVEAAPPASAPPVVEAAAAREVGVRVAAVAAGVSISLAGVPAGTTIEVTWVEEGTAAVYAGEGTTFTTSASQGRIDAAVAAGPVRVELPRSATRASLVVDGQVYLEKTGERIDYPGPPALVEGTRARFQVR